MRLHSRYRKAPKALGAATPEARRTPPHGCRVPVMRRAARHGGAIALAIAAASAGWPGGEARAQDEDYAPGSRAWNGLSELRQLGAEAGVAVQVLPRVDLSDLGPDDGLLLVYPRGDLPLSALAAFLRRGGRLAIADDFGDGGALLDLYGIRRREASLTDAPRLRSNPALPLARSRAGLAHPLVEGVGALVTNHPAVLRHAELEPLVVFDDGGAGLVVSGAVERGRLVAIGDPSVLINNMLQFRGNRRFATNLLRYLDGDRGGRVVLATGATPLVGSPGAGKPVRRAQEWLADVAGAEVPPLALQLGSAMLVALLVLIAASSLPRRSPYERHGPTSRSPEGGFLGRVRFFREHSGHLIHPLMIYKYELEHELVHVLGMKDRPVLRDVLATARERGLPEPDVQALRALLVELARLSDREDRPPDPARISEAQFEQMVESGERVIARLESRPAP